MNRTEIKDAIRFFVATALTLWIGSEYVIYFGPMVESAEQAAAFLVGLFLIPGGLWALLIKLSE